MTVESRDQLLARLPSRRTAQLRRAIGRTLVDVRRACMFDLDRFRHLVPEASDEDYFSLNLGPVEFRFDAEVDQNLSVWPGQLSVIVDDELPPVSGPDLLVSLRETKLASLRLRACLGRRCDDVRIWTYREDIETEEAKEAGVSYVLGDEELVYCIYLQDATDDDHLIFRESIACENVASVFSLRDQIFVSAP